MNGIIAAIYASFFLALSQGALKKSYKELEPSVAFFFDMIFALVLWVAVSLFFGVDFNNFIGVLPYAIISAILSEAFFFYALSKGQLSITSILIGSYPVYTVLFAFLLINERLSSFLYLFIAITIIGTLITYLPSKLNRKELKQSGAILWPLIAAVAIGFSDTISKGAIDRAGDFSFLFALAIVQIPVALIYLRIERQKVRESLTIIKENIAGYRNAIMGSLFNVIGTGLLWISFSKTYASVASPITATSGAIVVLLAVIFMEEKIGYRTALGLIMVFAGIIGISIYG